MEELISLNLLLRMKAEGLAQMQAAQSVLGGISKAALGIGGIAVASIVGFAAKSVESFISAGQAAYEMSEKFGIAKDKASEWSYIGQRVGVDASAMGIALRKLSVDMGKVTSADLTEAMKAQTAAQKEQLAIERDTIRLQTAKTPQARALLELSIQQAKANYNNALATINLKNQTNPILGVFRELGITAVDQTGKMQDMNAILLQVADKFSKMPDGAQKSADAIALFGRSGTNLIPILDEGAKGIQKMISEGKLAGAILSTDDVNAAHDAQMAWNKFKTEVEGLAFSVGRSLLPTFTNFVNWLHTTALPAAQDFGNWIKNTAVPKVHDWAQAIDPVLKQAWTNVQPTLSSIKDTTFDIGRNMIQIFTGTSSGGSLQNWVASHFQDAAIAAIKGVQRDLKELNALLITADQLMGALKSDFAPGGMADRLAKLKLGGSGNAQQQIQNLKDAYAQDQADKAAAAKAAASNSGRPGENAGQINNVTVNVQQVSSSDQADQIAKLTNAQLQKLMRAT